MTISFNINGQPTSLDVDGDMPLLWVVRDMLDLKGTKFGCGKAACGACTLHVDGKAIRSCSYAVKYAEGMDGGNCASVRLLSAWLHDGNGSPSVGNPQSHG